MFGCLLSGSFLPVQVIYQGTTQKCLPKNVTFPVGWHITCTANHWANESTSIAYIKNIIIPYVKKERVRLDLSADHSALVLFDVFKGQCTSEVLKLLEDNHILYVTIPNNCTDKLQPLDLSVNKPAKDFLRAKFQEWYGDQICRQLDDGIMEEVDLRLSILKPLAAQWMIDFYTHLMSHPSIIISGFRAAGIKDKLI